MLKVTNRGELERVKGAAPASPKPGPDPGSPPAAPMVAPEQVAALQQSLATIAEVVKGLPWLLANRPEPAPPPAPPKQLEGVVQRDSNGRIEKIVVTVIS